MACSSTTANTSRHALRTGVSCIGGRHVGQVELEIFLFDKPLPYVALRRLTSPYVLTHPSLSLAPYYLRSRDLEPPRARDFA